MSEGSIIRRGKRSWRVKYDLPRDETGARRIAYATVKGTRAEAEKERRRLLTALDKGMHVDPAIVARRRGAGQRRREIAGKVSLAGPASNRAAPRRDTAPTAPA